MLYRSAERAALETRPRFGRRALHLSAKRRQQTEHQRYGTANEPPPRLDSSSRPSGTEDPPTTVNRQSSDTTTKDVASKTSATSDNSAKQPIVTKSQSGDPMLDAPEVPPPQPLSAAIGPANGDKTVKSLMDNVPKPDQPIADAGQADISKIIHDEHQPPLHPPHIDAPRYVHNFDTFGLVKSLEDSGWESERAVTMMKSMRLMLADNLDLAREALVSKSQVENESYLFKAACSELRMEVQTRRRGEQEKMRTERAQLQHEVEIINQRFSQDSATLKDELKGMFDDRKMTVRNEQRELEGKIAELNYRITVMLQADSRSEIEGLRWIMTRRVIITLIVIVMMVLGSLKLFSNAMHDKEVEEKRRAAMRSVGTQADDGTATGTQTVEGQIVVNGGDNPAFVSLG